METCKECGAPAEIEDVRLMTMIDFDGHDGLIEVVKVRCAAGHVYNDTGAEVSP